MAKPLLEARHLTKRFPGIVALKDVNFDLQAGEIHALCGENGAGKSTLIKLLAGIHRHGSYEGALLVEGQPVAFRNLRDAEAAGIAVITQELALVDELSVAENIFLGRLPQQGWRVDWLEMHQRAAALLKDFGLDLSPELPVRQLGIGQKQLVEIVRAMDKRSRILVLDEPTAALTGQEVAVLLAHLRRLRAQGTACIYISHKLDEVFAIADRITVLRDGTSVATLPRAEATVPLVIKHMVGREITELYPPRHVEQTHPALRAPLTRGDSRHADLKSPLGEGWPEQPGCVSTESKSILSVRHLTAARLAGEPPFLKDISFDLYPGEVLGIGGLMGAGRTELLMHLFGAWGKRLGGEVQFNGAPYDRPAPRESIRRGLVLVSEDRRRYGLFLHHSVGFNLSLSKLEAFTRAGVQIDLPAEHVGNQATVEQLRIKAPSQETHAGGLSGGNQQKVVLGKAIMTQPSVVLFDEPTRGIDIGAKQEIYGLINRLTAEGKAVLLVSSELPELIGMSDRVIILSYGQIGGIFSREEFSQEKLLSAALGQEAK